MIEQVDFIPLPTQDIERAVHFYGTVLGLPMSKRLEDRWVEFETGNVTIGIMRPEAFGIDFRPTPNGIALRVTDVAAERERLEGEGVTFAGPTHDSGVCHMAFFTDPDGNALVLHRRYAPR